MSFQGGGASCVRSAYSDGAPPGRRHRSRPARPSTTSIRPSGSQSKQNGSSATRATTSLRPSGSMTRISPTPQSETQRRASCQRGDSPIRRPVLIVCITGVDRRRRPDSSLGCGEFSPLARERASGKHRGMATTESDVRAIALALPETEERPSYGTPGFRVKDRLFARIRAAGVLLVWCADEAEKDFLLRADPEKFFTTPHYDGHPSVLVRLGAVDRDELAELLTDSWRVRAPKRLAASLDG